MNKIQPTYSTFEQAKALKQKGFSSYTGIGYSVSGEKYYHQGGQESVINGQSYYEGRDYKGTPFLCSAPEQWQIIEWLRINKGIWIEISITTTDVWYFTLYSLKEKRNSEIDIENDELYFNTPQEATSAAIDYVLKELI
jgi:hypothetical protein